MIDHYRGFLKFTFYKGTRPFAKGYRLPGVSFRCFTVADDFGGDFGILPVSENETHKTEKRPDLLVFWILAFAFFARKGVGKPEKRCVI